MSIVEQKRISQDDYLNAAPNLNGESTVILFPPKVKENGLHNRLLDDIFEDAKNKEKKLEPIGFSEYVEGVLNGSILYDRNAPARQLRAIDSAGYEVLPNGYRQLHFFDDVAGQQKAKNQYCEALASGSKTGGKEDFFVFVGPLGVGKTLMTNTIKNGFSQFSKITDQPFYALEGCEMRCNPMALAKAAASPQTWEKIEERGIRVDTDLCPDCQAEIKTNGFRLEKRRVVPIHVTHGNGIVKLEPPDTEDSYFDKSKLVHFSQKAQGGILQIAELGKHGESFLSGINDLVSGRTLQDPNARQLQMDAVINADTTLEEWEEIKKKYPSLADRARLILLTYNLSVYDETQIYKKFANEVHSNVHISPMTLRVLAEGAVRSRLTESEKPGLTIDKKVALYDGKTLEDFGQSHVRQIQEEGEKKKEGLYGISPRFMKARLTALTPSPSLEKGPNEKSTEKQQPEQAQGCLDPIEALKQMKDFLTNYRDISFDDRTKLIKHYSAAQKSYDLWLTTTLRKAFRPNYEQDVQIQFQEYVKNVGLYLDRNREQLLDSFDKYPVEADEKFMRAIESKAGISEVVKKGFREEVDRKILTALKELRTQKAFENHPPTSQALSVSMLKMEHLEKGIDGVLFEQTGDPAKLIEPFASIESESGKTTSQLSKPEVRSRYVKDPQQDKKLCAAAETLKANYDCCDQCAWKQLAYAARNDLLKKK